MGEVCLGRGRHGGEEAGTAGGRQARRQPTQESAKHLQPEVGAAVATAHRQDRPYRVFVPPTLDQARPVPLVVVLHGGANTSRTW